MNRRLGLVTLLAALAIAAPARADSQQTITFQYPPLPGAGNYDDDGLLVSTAHTFQEAGMHVESFWVKNTTPAFAPDAHSHVKFPNPWEQSHGFGQSAGLGPDRQGLYLRREDGGPFTLHSIDLRLIQPAAADFLIGETYDPHLPAEAQLTPFPMITAPNFQTILPTGFENVTQLFVTWNLTEDINDRAEMDNIVVSFPHGSCSQSVPGGVVFAHSGQADPVTEGWTRQGAGTGVVAGPLSDGGVDAWGIDDDSNATGSVHNYNYFPSPDVMCWARTAGLRLRARVRIADTPDAVDGSVVLSFTDSQRLHELRIGSNALGQPAATLSGQSVPGLTALGSGYHTYEIAYDPVTRTSDLLVDGVERLSNRAGFTQNVSAPTIRFGSIYDSGTGQGNFASVEVELPHRCSNGVDDDGDGSTDYPADPGCASPSDDTETTLCTNGIDDDGDGAVDFPADAGCTDANDDDEHSALLVCDDGIDNDADTLIDFPADPGCTSPLDADETTLCSNGLDDDGDGAIDFPADPGCDDANDDSEQSLALACDDGLDNDGDGVIDFPADPGCFAPNDPTETTACSNGLDDDGDGLVDFPDDAGCADALDDSERSDSLVCDDGIDNDGDTLIDFPADAGCSSILDATETTACANGLDDDGDGAIDFPADPGCASADDDLEKSEALVCDDGIDNDGDTTIDFPADAGCTSLLDETETAACSNGLDDDGDGLADFPLDPGCASADDDDERSEALVCDDGLDNDGDTLIDFPSDGGCASPTDDDESAACSNGIDDDGDGATDFPADAGCDSAADDDEHSAAIACDDGIDNDGDGLADFPQDPGCVNATDESEKSPNLPCDDGIDNDGDGATDWPADIGCRAVDGGTESPQCQDGIDNELDGLIDFDGGASLNGGVAITAPDPQCQGNPARSRETAASRCGLGAEVAFLLPLLQILRRRRASR